MERKHNKDRLAQSTGLSQMNSEKKRAVSANRSGRNLNTYASANSNNNNMYGGAGNSNNNSLSKSSINFMAQARNNQNNMSRLLSKNNNSNKQPIRVSYDSKKAGSMLKG